MRRVNLRSVHLNVILAELEGVAKSCVPTLPRQRLDGEIQGGAGRSIRMAPRLPGTHC